MPRLVGARDWVPISLSLKGHGVHVGYYVLLEVADKSLLLVGNPQVILGRQHKPRPIRLSGVNYDCINYL
jgi:hypothetical protein